MKFDDAFYGGFKDELQKEALIPQALMLGGRMLAGAKALGVGAKAVGTAVKAKGVATAAKIAKPVASAAKSTVSNIASKAKSAAGAVTRNIPFMMGSGGSQPQQKKTNTYV
jgi:hypothetical protein